MSKAQSGGNPSIMGPFYDSGVRSDRYKYWRCSGCGRENVQEDDILHKKHCSLRSVHA